MAPARRVRLSAFLLLAIVLMTACGGGGKGGTTPTGSPVPTFTPGKPGGTLRVIGTVRSVPLDPAKARDDAALLVNRLIYRQLYSYRPGDPNPQPDLAAGPPVLSSDRLTATITLGPARWNTTGGRNVTSGDALRAMKRLCLPSVLAPERGYLSEVVVGYSDFCSRVSKARLGAAGQPDLDQIDVTGLRAVGDAQLQIALRRPTADLQQILALPALSPLPFEIKDGFPEPTSLINDGPYRFIDPEPGEAYRLSRNASWDPAGDQIRAALVDRISFRGGFTPEDVQRRLESNDADLSWDVETPVDVLRRLPTASSTASDSEASPTPTASPSPSPSFGTARVEDRDLAVVAVGARGPATRQLGSVAVRQALAACLDRTALQTAFGGSGRALPTDALLTPDYLDVPNSGQSGSATPGAPTPSSPTASPTATGAGSTARPGTSSSRRVSPSPAATTPGVLSKPLTVEQCRTGLTAAGLRPGTSLVLLSGDTPDERAGAAALSKRLSDAGLAVQSKTVPADRYRAAAASGGWDLSLSVLRPDFPGSRAVLAPLLDAHWPGERAAGAARRSAAWYNAMVAGLAEERPDRVAEQELALSGTLALDASFVGALRVATVRTTGPNVGQNPPLAMLGNADPANVALGVTRPTESPSPTSASS